MVEFSGLRLEQEMQEDIRLRVLQQSAGSFTDYPVQLFQLRSRGIAQNRTPLIEHKRIPLHSGGGAGPVIKYVRLYFDGLVAHVHLTRGVQLGSEYLQSCLGLGMKGWTLVFGHKFEESRTWDNIKEMIRTVNLEEQTPPFEMTPIANAVSIVAKRGAASRSADAGAVLGSGQP